MVDDGLGIVDVGPVAARLQHHDVRTGEGLELAVGLGDGEVRIMSAPQHKGGRVQVAVKRRESLQKGLIGAR